MTRLGDFLNFLVANFRTKAVQIFGDFLDYFYNAPYLPAAVTIFGQLLENFGLLFFKKHLVTLSLEIKRFMLKIFLQLLFSISNAFSASCDIIFGLF